MECQTLVALYSYSFVEQLTQPLHPHSYMPLSLQRPGISCHQLGPAPLFPSSLSTTGPDTCELVPFLLKLLSRFLFPAGSDPEKHSDDSKCSGE